MHFFATFQIEVVDNASFRACRFSSLTLPFSYTHTGSHVPRQISPQALLMNSAELRRRVASFCVLPLDSLTFFAQAQAACTEKRKSRWSTNWWRSEK